MKNLILFDNSTDKTNLLPLSYTRPLCDLRVGIDTIREKWEAAMPGCYSILTEDYLNVKYSANICDDNIFIRGNIIPDAELIRAINNLNIGEYLCKGEEILAVRGTKEQYDNTAEIIKTEYEGDIRAVRFLYDIFTLNDAVLRNDFTRFTAGKKSQPIPESNTVIGDPSLIFVEEGAQVEGAYLNSKTGPIYLAANTEVMEGSCLRGPIAVCEHSNVNMGSKIYGATTIGPWCKVGGELNNVVMIGFSNKAHDGFLGNAVIGEWCNLGADCVASNLKNDYSKVRVWNYPTHRFQRTDLQFCGLIMGDHSKAGINTMFNTATVVGVGCNIHGSGFPRTFIPSFSEGGTAGFNDVQLSKFFDIAERAMARRHKQLTEADRRIFEEIYRIADTYK